MIDRRKFLAASAAAVVGGPQLLASDVDQRVVTGFSRGLVSFHALFREGREDWAIFPYDPNIPGSYEKALDDAATSQGTRHYD